MSGNQKEINELRKVMGTLPSSQPQMKTDIVRGCSNLRVTLVDYPTNPYKAIFSAATATWGNDEYEDKWKKTSPEGRFLVVQSALRGDTLPHALECINFTFKVTGVPRHCFDQHARARVGATFYSIGCRDNNKLDASMILYTKVYDRMQKDAVFNSQMRELFSDCKSMYDTILADGKGSWQSARTVLPMCYHHPYHFSMNFLSLKQQCAHRMMFCEEEFIVGVHWSIKHVLSKKFPLLSAFLVPACDIAHKCVYAKSYSLSNAFGCLFKGCGRWKSETDYASFNSSCTDVKALEAQLGFEISSPLTHDSFLKSAPEWGGTGYDCLSDADKKLFETD